MLTLHHTIIWKCLKFVCSASPLQFIHILDIYRSAPIPPGFKAISTKLGPSTEERKHTFAPPPPNQATYWGRRDRPRRPRLPTDWVALCTIVVSVPCSMTRVGLWTTFNNKSFYYQVHAIIFPRKRGGNFSGVKKGGQNFFGWSKGEGLGARIFLHL